jgi:hypothetical protein
MLEKLNAVGKVTATEEPSGADAPKADTTLPDPTLLGKVGLAALIALSVGLAFLLNIDGWATPEVPFKPSEDEEANFALFAGFYVAAQIIVAVMALFAPLLPPWKAPDTVTDPTAKAAQLKADRVVLVLGLSTVFGVAVSCAFGLFFLQAVGFDTSRQVDAIATGLVIAGGAKPLKDFIATLQNQTTPRSGTATSDTAA